MYYLLSSGLFLALALTSLRRRRLAVLEARGLYANQDQEVVSLDDDEPGPDRAAQAGAGWQVLGLLCFVLAVGFAALFVLRTVFFPPVSDHGVRLTHEEFGAYSLGQHLSATLTAATVKTVVVVPATQDQHFSGLAEQVSEGLDSSRFDVRVARVVPPPADRRADHRVTPELFHKLLESHGDAKLLVSLVAFSASDDPAAWRAEKRPYIAVLSEKAELDHNVLLVRKGAIDLTLVSRGQYAPRCLIPAELPLETVRERNFLVISATNAVPIARRFRQTISAVQEE